MKDIVIIGAGGVGRETAMLIEEINKVKPTWTLIGFIDDNESLWGDRVNGYPILGGTDDLNKVSEEIYGVCAISNPQIKKQAVGRISNLNFRFATLIHPSAIISKDCEMGIGIIIQANCVITTNVKLGNHVQINPQCGIGHESIIMDYSSLYWNVNISGKVIIEEECVLGTKATVIQGLKIGTGAVIGSAANVIRDIPSYCTAVGNPAKPIKFSEGGK